MTNGIKIVRCGVCGAVAEVSPLAGKVNAGEDEKCASKPIDKCQNLRRAIEQGKTLQ